MFDTRHSAKCAMNLVLKCLLILSIQQVPLESVKLNTIQATC